MKNEINQIIEKIKEYDKIALFQHKRPDGDSISSSIGLGMALKLVFPKKEIVIVSDYEYLVKSFKFIDFNKKMFKDSIDDSYLGIIGDVAIKDRIIKFDELSKTKEIICFDHHTNTSDLNASIMWAEPKYSASAIQAYEIIEELGVELDEDTAVMLMVGILTDTGFFKYSAANSKPLITASKLFKYISDERMRKFYREMSTKTKKDLEIQAYILQNVKYDKNVAYLKFPKEIIEKYTRVAIKMRLSLIANIEGTTVWAFFMNEKNDEGEYIWTCSLRSSKMKVSLVGQKWNGGGHFLAAGAKAKNGKEVDQIIKDLNKLKETV